MAAAVIRPLAGPDRQILELLEAGRTFDDVCEIGAYRGTWRPSAVHRVISQWLPARRPARLKPAEPATPVRPGPARRPIKHGTYSGSQLERRYGLPVCDQCREAARLHEQQRRASRKRTA